MLLLFCHFRLNVFFVIYLHYYHNLFTNFACIILITNILVHPDFCQYSELWQDLLNKALILKVQYKDLQLEDM